MYCGASKTRKSDNYYSIRQIIFLATVVITRVMTRVMTIIINNLVKSRQLHSLWLIIAISSLILSGCATQQMPAGPAPVITVAPDIELDPNLKTPLAGLLTIETDVPTRIKLEISTSKNNWSIDLKKLATHHSTPVLGLRPDTTHSIKVHAISESGAITTYKEQLSILTDPLPDGFPSIEVKSQPDKMEPGYTLIEVIPEGSKNKGFGALIIIVDETGEVVWYTTGTRFTDVRQLANGNLVFLTGNKAIEMDMMGNAVQEWKAVGVRKKKLAKMDVRTRTFHHELFPMDNGNFLVLSVEARNYPDFPTSAKNAKALRENALVAGDLVVEFDPDGKIVNSWSMLKMLMPLRIGYGSLGSYWNNTFGGKKTRDWSHGNAVTHQPEDDSIIVTLRHQDTTVKFNRKTGELIWILAPQANWDMDRFGQYLLKPATDDIYFFPYHHHAHEVMPNGNLLLYDNGSYGSSPFTPYPRRIKPFSRAIEYKINETSKEVEIAWEYGQHAENIFYSGALGDADYQPETGNVLITHGSLTTKVKINSAVIIEVTHTTPGKEVFVMTLYDDSPELEGGWRVYRAERIADLYSQ